jgi:hypothetical protein
MTINPHSTTIPGAFFQSGYAVYVVEIKHLSTGAQYFYIGQTGDANHHTARSPFYRMSGHFEYGQSTQNQIFKALCKVLSVDEKADGEVKREAVEKLLIQSSVTYHVFRLFDFSYEYEDYDQHHRYRHSTLVVETALLHRFKRKYGDSLLNTRLNSLNRTPTEQEAEYIIKVVEELERLGILKL